MLVPSEKRSLLIQLLVVCLVYSIVLRLSDIRYLSKGRWRCAKSQATFVGDCRAPPSADYNIWL